MSKKAKKKAKKAVVSEAQATSVGIPEISVGITTPRTGLDDSVPQWYLSRLLKVRDNDRETLSFTQSGSPIVRLYEVGEAYPQDYIATHTLIVNLIPDYRARVFWDEGRQQIVGFFIDIDNDPFASYPNRMLYENFFASLNSVYFASQIYQFIDKYKKKWSSFT